MKTISFFDTKPYDVTYFNQLKGRYDLDIVFHESKLNAETAILAKGSDVVCAFVNDTLDKETIELLVQEGVQLIAMRCAGYNNIDLDYAYGKLHIVRVPAYSPHAVAEAAIGMLLMLNRKFHKSYNRTREFNFSLNGLTGFDLYGKTLGVIGTGKIGRTFIDVCSGFEMNIIMSDPYPVKGAGYNYVSFDEICEKADIISLHCPLTKDNYHLINKESIEKMKKGVFIINTSRGALIDSEALVDGLVSGKIGAAGLDVYEEESEFFFEDYSNKIIQDDTLARLVTLPNVLVTSHQAFLTKEALENIATTTLQNVADFFEGKELVNEVCSKCAKNMTNCQTKSGKPCF